MKGADKLKAELDKITAKIENKPLGDADSEDVQFVKGLVRKVETHRAAMKLGVPDENIFFLDLPFYQTGQAKKKQMSPKDIEIHRDLINRLKPDVIFCAGDLTDPHGTHRLNFLV